MIELQIILLCFRSQNLEKRIYGLQQFCEKINQSLSNEYLVNDSQSHYRGAYNEKWLVPKTMLEFVV